MDEGGGMSMGSEWRCRHGDGRAMSDPSRTMTIMDGWWRPMFSREAAMDLTRASMARRCH